MNSYQDNFLIIQAFQDMLSRVRENEKFFSLAEKKFNNQDYLEFYYDACEDEDNTGKLQDIMLCSNDIGYCLSYLAVYRPYLNRTPHLPFQRDTIEGSIFCRYLNMTFERYYNFWDRIGDLLNFHFKLLPERIEDFSRVIDKLNNIKSSSLNYEWLKNFKDNDFNIINNSFRKIIVHHYNIESYFINKLTEVDFDNSSEMLKLKNEFYGLVDFLFTQHQNTFTGFEKAINLIAELKK